MSNQQQYRSYAKGVKEYKTSSERKESFKKATQAIRAIDHPIRSKMVDFIEKNPRSPVTDIYIKMRLEQSVASQHLRILKDAGLVFGERDGKSIKYSVCSDRKKKVESLVEEF